MKKGQKFILPGLIIVVVAVLYLSYFAPTDELGDFSNFDTNSNAGATIAVKYIKEKGVTRSDEGTVFYVVDRKNKEVQVSGPASLPPGFDDAKSIVLLGHLTRDHFHAHNVELRN